MNGCGYDVLSVQHEYGIFGGEAGCLLMNLVRRARMPIVTTLHTVLRDPSPAQKIVMDELLHLSARVVVMSRKAFEFLAEVHGLPPEKVDLIPHGIPDIRKAAGRGVRDALGIDGPMILTFGLLSQDKGVQYVIEAMPKIVGEHPGATYVVVGATHPHVRSSAGEAYRESLIALARRLRVAGNVRFVNRFVATDELVEYLAAMDFYVTPYLNPRQITSGTLAYAVGAGKTVVSTPYWYAEELLADGRGLLVPFRDADAIAEAVLMVQREPAMRQEMGRRAGELGMHMLWPEVGRKYLASFTRGVAARSINAPAVRDLVGPQRASADLV
jgi:glycosyltransferase involved in cell wall biosynthesis